MVTAYSPILKLALPVQGELSGTWGDVVNDNITSMVEQAIAGRAVIDTWTVDSHTLTTANGTTSESRCAMLELTDTGVALTGAGTVICPTASKIYIVKNASGQNITVKTSAGTGILVPNGRTTFLFCDGTNVVEAMTHTTSLQLGTSTVVTAVLDEDNMASDDPAGLATQQSIKAYVDAQVGANNELSEVLANGNTTGGNDILFGDNDKAIFGAGSDLQIYHDGSHSYIEDAGAGTLNLKADAIYAGLGNQGYMDFYRSTYTPGTTGLRIGVGSANQHEITTLSGIDLVLKRDTDEKLRLTSTGIDVTGTVTADGLTVDGGATSPTISITGARSGTLATISNTSTATSNGLLVSTTSVSANSNPLWVRSNNLSRLKVAGNGDISFYEDTGTTPKFFWDASAESLGIGTSSPSATLDVSGTIKLDGNYPLGGDNVALGATALNSVESTGKWNVAIGDQALTNNTTGDGNVGIGRQALTTQTTALNNIAIGFQAGYFTTTGGNNIAIGSESFKANTTGISNVAVGRQSLFSSTTAINSTAVGYQSAYSNTTGNANSAFGYQAAFSNTTGASNVAIGFEANHSNITGDNNTAVGREALRANTADNNTAVGYQSLLANTTGTNNTANGYLALSSNTTASNNTAVGDTTLRFNTTGASNVAVGVDALRSNTTADNNTAVGYQSLYDNTEGTQNTALGQGAAANNTTGNQNTALGALSLLASTTGNQNTAVGYQSLYDNTTGSNNTALGRSALANNTTGTNNTAIGDLAGSAITTGSGNTIIGANIDGTAALADTVIIGSNNAERMRIDSSGNVGIGTTSPTGRTEIADNGLVNDRLLFLNSSGGASGGQTGPLYGLYSDIKGNNSSTAAYGAYMNAIPSSGSAYGVFAESTQPSSSKDSIAIYGNATVNSSSSNHRSNRAIGGGPVAGVYATTSTTGTNMSAQTTALHALNATVYGSEAYGAWIETTAGPTTVVPLKVAHAGSELMRIDSSGNVGIGTTSPAHPLDVTGTIRSDVSTTGDFNFYATSDGGGAFRIYPDDATTANPTWQYQSNSSEDQAWVIGGVERMRIDSGGRAIIPAGVTLGTSAGVYNAANTLNDYEEGTWTPVISDGTNDATSNIAVGTYTKVGNLVHVQGRIVLSSLGSVSGAVQLKGLPFNSKALSNNFGVLVVGRASLLNRPAGLKVSGDLRSNVDYVNLILNDTNSGTSNMQSTEFTDDGDIAFSMQYITA